MALGSIEVQVISYMITVGTDENRRQVAEKLLSFDDSYYNVFQSHIRFIRKHYEQYNSFPDVFTFQSTFHDFEPIIVNEPVEMLIQELTENKKHIILIETFNKLKDLGENDVSDAWKYIDIQSRRVQELNSSEPMDIIHEAQKRIQQVLDYNKQARIPTGFNEIDKLMYGGLSTVEELLLILARTGTGKSWICTKIAESAQVNGFNVAYYSPEMQASFLATRIDTWKGHFANSQLFRGNYTDDYLQYIQKLETDSAHLYVIEDKDAPGNIVNVPYLDEFVRKNNIKLLIVDGLSYLDDVRSRPNDMMSIKYKNECEDLFRLSKKNGCAVVVVVQANRATKDTKDEKGDPFPNIYNIEGSDYPARIATQIFAVRQIFEKHILDIRLEKARNAANQRPLVSYSWDINTGGLTYLPDANSEITVSTPTVTADFIAPDFNNIAALQNTETDLDIDEDVEF